VLKLAAQASSWYANSAYFRGDPLPWLPAGLTSANLAERARDRSIAGTAYVNLAAIFGNLHMRRVEATYLALASESPEPRVRILHDWAIAVNDIIHCDWEHARATVDRGIALARNVSDYWALANGLAIKGLVHYYSGPVPDSLPHFDELMRMTRERSNHEQQGYGMILSVPPLMSQGRLDDADALLEDGYRLLDRFDYFSRVAFFATRAGLRLRQRRLEEAVSDAVEAMRLFAAKPLMMFLYGAPFAMVAEVLLAADATGEDVGAHSRSAISEQLANALGKFGQGAFLFNFFRPRSLMSRGTAQWQRGRSARGRRSWDKALATAERLDMPWDQARVHLEIARHLPADNPERKSHMEKAQALLGPMAGSGDVEFLVPPSV